MQKAIANQQFWLEAVRENSILATGQRDIHMRSGQAGTWK